MFQQVKNRLQKASIKTNFIPTRFDIISTKQTAKITAQ